MSERVHPMSVEEARSPRCLLFEVVSGSRAYGTDTPESDTDLKGVFVQPLDGWLGWHRMEQVNTPDNNETYYEVGRFADLLEKNNPNLLELLFSPPDCVRFQHPLMALFRPEQFLSRRCRDTFAGYALAQIHKARGLNKKVFNPQLAKRLELLDFCHVAAGQGSVPVKEWLANRGWKQEHCGLVALSHMPRCFGLYHDPPGGSDMRGLIGSVDATELSVSRVPPGVPPEAFLHCNLDGFKKHCREHTEYLTWVAERNPARYEATLRNGQGYDAKNLMHVFRLLDSAEGIARHGRLEVRVSNREELMAIRSGQRPYEELIQRAEQRMAEIEKLFDSSPLPDAPDTAKIEALVVEVRKAFYRETGQAFAG